MGTYSETGEGYCESCSGYDVTLMKGATSAAQCVSLDLTLDSLLSIFPALLSTVESSPCSALSAVEEILEGCNESELEGEIPPPFLLHIFAFFLPYFSLFLSIFIISPPIFSLVLIRLESV